MEIDINSVFYQKGKNMLDEYVLGGGKVEDLTKEDQVYKYIKNSKVFDQAGNRIDLETRFALLGHPRESKRSIDLRGDLIREIEEYIASGGSFYVERKKQPYYEKLSSYCKALKREGKILTHEQIMRDDLGFKEYSEMCYRCKDLKKFVEYEDENGFVDDYHMDKVMSSYVTDLAITIGIPYYLIITLLVNKKLKYYDLQLDKIKYIERRLKNYAITYGSFVGMKRSDPNLYNEFDYLTRYYTGDNGERLSKADWLYLFGLQNVDHRFKDVKQYDGDIDQIMIELKEKYGSEIIKIKDIDSDKYRMIVKDAVFSGVRVSEVFARYNLRCNGINMPRISKVRLRKVPYIEEMKKRLGEIIKSYNIKNDECEEVHFDAKVKAVQQVYLEFKDKLENYLPKEEIVDSISHSIY